MDVPTVIVKLIPAAEDAGKLSVDGLADVPPVHAMATVNVKKVALAGVTMICCDVSPTANAGGKYVMASVDCGTTLSSMGLGV